jgi:hypothetical protein
MKSSAATIDEYAAMVPAGRQADFQALLGLVRKNMPAGYEEAMTWGMPTWEVPLSRYPDTYNKKPLMYVAIASQKNNLGLYLTSPYIEGTLEKFQKEYEATGKKLDMGKSCIRFKKFDDLASNVIAAHIASVPPERCIALYEAVKKK